MKQNPEIWTTIISPKSSWFDIDLIGLWKARDLILLFVRRDFVSFYKQTILGPLWFFIQPLITTIVFTIIFGNIAKIPTDGVPPFLFYMAGIVPWTYFANCMDKSARTFTDNAAVFGKVYFPRLAVPISIVITNLLTFFIQFSALLAFIAYFYFSGAYIKPNIWILATPLLLIQTAALALGIGLVISSLTTRYRDLTFLIGFGIQLWMYATPIVYPISQVGEKWRGLLALNPMSSIVETFRYAYLGSGGVIFEHILISATMTAAILCVGIILFSRAEKTFMDTV
ncbi:MAG: ABC transporter permease [Pseudomonadota bacterium]